jgi:hypothetical protein
MILATLRLEPTSDSSMRTDITTARRWARHRMGAVAGPVVFFCIPFLVWAFAFDHPYRFHMSPRAALLRAWRTMGITSLFLMLSSITTVVVLIALGEDWVACELSGICFVSATFAVFATLGALPRVRQRVHDGLVRITTLSQAHAAAGCRPRIDPTTVS